MATVWMQRDEYRYYTGEAWHAKNTHGGVFEEDVQMLVTINLAGRLRFVNGDDQEPVPGIRCYTGGRHTYASQYVSAATDAGTVVLTSDNVYLYENLDKRVPIAQTLDAAVEPEGSGSDPHARLETGTDRPGSRSGGVRSLQGHRAGNRQNPVTNVRGPC